MRFLFTLALALTGCATFRPYSPDVTRAFRLADRIVVEDSHEIADRDTINGLRNVYRTANWDWTPTKPVLGQSKTLLLYRGSEELLQFRASRGVLAENGRIGLITDYQKRWIEEHVLSVPSSKNSSGSSDQ